MTASKGCKDQKEKDLNIINDINIIRDTKMSGVKIGDYICCHPQHRLEVVTEEKCLRFCRWSGKLVEAK